MGLMGLVIAIIVGALVGWLGSIIMKTDKQMGALANIIVGIVGAWLGRFLAGLIGLAAYNSLGNVIVSIVGACALIAILKAAGFLK
ncbi:MAG TPA: GlsB/YeaQ/YmgE family stress response membrane protein [Vicinamibacterales bacterium]|nr:GlsB/YeaQ/YmgE family stress response membrane protein [Vicinamibacterales bacterium]